MVLWLSVSVDEYFKYLKEKVDQIKKKLNEIKETKTPKQKAEEVRDVVKQAKKAVRDNPTKKLNDIKIK